MLKYVKIIILFILMVGVNVSNAQEDPGLDEVIEWAWKGDFRPYLEISYGYLEPMHDKFTAEFAKIGSFQAKLGYSDISPYKKYVLSMDERYLFFSMAKEEYNYVDSEVTGVVTEAMNFGFGNRLGFGYDIGPLDIIPYSQFQYVWTEFNALETPGTAESDIAILDRYANAFRFGHSSEAGATIRLMKSISVGAGYEFSVIYPRVIFWPWLGSQIIQSSALGMVSVFSEDIVNSSPLLGPLMYFILRNGAAYAMYQGYKTKMNWPFASETPLTHEAFKINASITF